MSYYSCLYILCLATHCSRAYGQEVTLSNPHPITQSELTSSLIPVVVENDNQHYFVKHVYHPSVHYGGLLSKEWLPLNPKLLSFYTSSLFHVDVQRKGALIGTDTSLHRTYYTNSNAQRGQFTGLFATPPYGHRIKKLVLPGFNTSEIHSFYINKTWDVLVFSTQKRKGAAREDLYVSVMEEGHWSTPVSLGASINTEGAEISPFLTPDMKHLFFSSDGHGGYGRGDLFVAERLYDSWQVWSQPVNLGSDINSSGYEAYLSIMEDSVAYFFSEINGQGKLWTARATLSRRSAPKKADNRRYLDQEEIHAWLGTNVDTTLSFAADGITPSQESQELLWFVANRMMNTPDIHIDISFLASSAEDQTKERAIIVRNYFGLLGVDEGRVATQTVATSNRSDEATLSFFRRE